MVNTEYTGKAILLNELSKALNKEVTEQDLTEAIEILKNSITTQFDDEKSRLNRIREISIFNYIYDLDEETRRRTPQEIKDHFSVSTEIIDIIDKKVFLSIVRILENQEKNDKPSQTINRNRKRIR